MPKKPANSQNEVRGVTIADVAKAAGVSVPTVSRILNNKEYVADDYRCYMLPDEGMHQAVVIASEPFTSVKSEWTKVSRNSMVIVEDDLTIRFADIELPFEKAEFVYQQ